MRILRLLLCAAFLPPALLAQPNFITSLYPTQHALNVPAGAELRVGVQKRSPHFTFGFVDLWQVGHFAGHGLNPQKEIGTLTKRIVR
jgi:hypothetical protein